VSLAASPPLYKRGTLEATGRLELRVVQAVDLASRARARLDGYTYLSAGLDDPAPSPLDLLPYEFLPELPLRSQKIVPPAQHPKVLLAARSSFARLG